jgi:hypothetical protein
MYRMIRVLLLLLLTGVSQQASAKSRLADTTRWIASGFAERRMTQ